MTKRKPSNDYHTPSVIRAIEIVEYLSDHPDGVSVKDLAKAVSIPFNSAYRISMTLLDRDYLVRDPDTKLLTISKRFLDIGHKALGHVGLIEVAMEHLRMLRDELDATALAGTLLDTQGVVLATVPGGTPFKLMVDPGTRLCLHASAPGKALTAFLGEKERKALVARLTLTRYNDRTITNPDDLLADLELTRQRGYAVDRAEQFEAVHCVAVPILLQANYPAATIWVTAPSAAIPEERFKAVADVLKHHASAISKRLGYEVL